MRIVLTDDFGKILLNGEEIPGEYQHCEISGEVKMDRFDMGETGSSKIPLGFSDSNMKLRLILKTDTNSTCYEKLKKVNSMFKKVDEYGKPIIYRIVNAHTDARDLNDVSFISLRSVDDNKRDWIIVELGFEEYRPVLLESEQSIDYSQVPSEERIGFGDSQSSSGGHLDGDVPPSVDTDYPR